ncbi:MAG: glycosyl hydrolase [Deltaproteobacteria bacterium]|nr:glycosyl hydrolase [Deltaproteobacteria bacterium]
MVLERHDAPLRTWWLALGWVSLALAASGCVHKPPVLRLPDKTPVAIAFVLDGEHAAGASDVPEVLKKKVVEQLSARNLDARVLPFDSYAKLFEPVRDTHRRLAKLANGGAPLVVLVETKVVYFSLINGRYRWMVYARLSAAKKDGSTQPLTLSMDQSAFVDYEHEKEQAALGSVSNSIADRLGVLLDDFLGGEASEGAKPPESSSFTDPRQSAIYFVMVDRFANGDSKNDGAIDLKDPAAFHGGDLQGILDHLDELKAMGVGTLWLSPVFQMRTDKFFGHGAFHGYWTEDLTRIEPRFGDVALLRKLSGELHERGMRLMLDVVLNHVAMDAPLTRERPDWFHRQGALTNWSDPEELVSRDVHGLPDLAQEREDVYAHLLQASLRWVEEVRPDGFRLDAVKHVPLGFWARYNEAVRQQAGPQFLLLGEMLDGDAATLARTQREGKFGAMFDFPLYFAIVDVFCRERSALKIGAALSGDRVYEDPGSLVTLLDNHDLARVTTDCGGDLDRVRRALTVQLTARGTPALTWGIESALQGAKEPDNRGDMRFDTQPLRDHIARLLKLRREHPALWSGAPWLLEADEGTFAYARIAPDEAAIIAVNQRSSPVRITIPKELAGAAREPLADRPIEGRVLEVAGKSVLVALVTSPETGGFARIAERAQAQWRRGEQKRVVEIEASGAPAQQGDGVLLVGAAPEMGSWNPAQGLPVEGGMARAQLPVGGIYDFKLVVRSAAGQAVWEDGDNRSLVVPKGEGPVRAKVAWNVRP